jgi:hypothetical protein
MPAHLLTTASRRLASLGAVGVLVCGGVAGAQTHAGKRALAHAGLTRPPAAFTEVVLRRATVDASLPQRPAVEVEVAIHDAGPHALGYRYGVSVQPRGGVAVVAGRGSVAVAAHSVRAVRVRVPLRCERAPRAYVAVAVEPQPGRSVGAWVTCPPAPGRSR